MNELEKLRKERQNVLEAGVIYAWLRHHIKDIDPCDANSGLLADWMVQHNLPFTHANLDIALVALGDKLAKPAAEQTYAPTPPPAAPTLVSVAPIPAYFPPMNSQSDIRKISSETYKKFFFGPQAEAFKARIAAIQQGVQPAVQNATAPTAHQALDAGSGLPPAPNGLVWASTVAELNEMPREEFRNLFHSQRYGAMFRARIEAIYARERGKR